LMVCDLLTSSMIRGTWLSLNSCFREGRILLSEVYIRVQPAEEEVVEGSMRKQKTASKLYTFSITRIGRNMHVYVRMSMYDNFSQENLQSGGLLKNITT
jgi:hypothetical protein